MRMKLFGSVQPDPRQWDRRTEMSKKVIVIAGLLILVVAAAAFLLLGRDDPFEPEYTEEQMAAEHEEEGMTQESPDDVEIIDEDYDPDVVLTLEEALPVMLLYGYQKTDNGYQAVENTPDVNSVRVVNAKGNHVTVDLVYDYGKDNKEMIDFYKGDTDDAVSIMVASFLTRLADRANAQSGTMEYTIRVGDKKVKSGSMTLSDARKYQAMSAE